MTRAELKEALNDCENALIRTRAELAAVERQRDEALHAMYEARVEAGVVALKLESVEAQRDKAQADVDTFLNLYKKTVDRYEAQLASLHIAAKWVDS